MRPKATKNCSKSTNIWSKIDENLMKFLPKCEQKSSFFSLGFFSKKTHTKKDRSRALGGWTWPSGETESAYLNHWIFSWNTQTCRDQHENINRKRPSRGVHFRITFIIAICRCLESFCFCCYLLSLDGTCCCCLWRFNACYYLRPGPLPFAPCFLLFAAVLCNSFC